MTEKKIQKHRERIPLPLDEITMYSSFVQLLGEKPSDYTPEERLLRWEKNLALMKAAGESELYDFWKNNNEMCGDCVHLSADKNNWCTYAELPALYNPVIKAMGMACCGLVCVQKGQQEMDFNSLF